MDIKELQNKVLEAVDLFMNQDGNLLFMGTHEQAISHRIAVYLEKLFGKTDLNFDCEYNQHLGEDKKTNIAIDPDKCKNCVCRTCRKIALAGINSLEEKLFRPDIVIHKRNNDDNNKVVIEVKRYGSCPFDEAKLSALTLKKERTGSYGYKLGVAINFSQDKPHFKWFIDGEQC